MSLQTCAVCPARAGHLQQTAARELEGVVGRGREAASRIRTVHQVHLGNDGSQGLSCTQGSSVAGPIVPGEDPTAAHVPGESPY